MSDSQTAEQEKAPRDGIPTPMLDELHDANEKFHRAREHVEQANEALVNPTEERQRASSDMREAEQALEAIEEKIGRELNKPSGGSMQGN